MCVCMCVCVHVCVCMCVYVCVCVFVCLFWERLGVEGSKRGVSSQGICDIIFCIYLF